MGGPFRSLSGGAQFPTKILGQFANEHRLKDGMPQDPLPTRSDDPWAGWGQNALKWGRKGDFFGNRLRGS